jgi:hypothetical protein
VTLPGLPKGVHAMGRHVADVHDVHPDCVRASQFVRHEAVVAIDKVQTIIELNDFNPWECLRELQVPADRGPVQLCARFLVDVKDALRVSVVLRERQLDS